MTQRLASWLSPTNVGRVGSPLPRRPDTSQVTSAPYHIRSAVGSAAATPEHESVPDQTLVAGDEVPAVPSER